MALDLSPFRRAVAQLGAALDEARAEPGRDLLRDGAIQRFAYTYELSHKVLRRYLEQTEPAPEQVRESSFPALIRLGSERGLLASGWDAWSGHRRARGTTSHTDDGAKAAEVFANIPAFLEDARSLIEALVVRCGQMIPSVRIEQTISIKAVHRVVADGRRAFRPRRCTGTTAGAAVTSVLDVEPRWLSLVRRILAALAPRPCRVWAFGSRTEGRARRFSDLDLAVDAGRALTIREEGALLDAFDESDLPWRVDVVDLASCGPAFRRAIEAAAILVVEIGGADA